MSDDTVTGGGAYYTPARLLRRAEADARAIDPAVGTGGILARVVVAVDIDAVDAIIANPPHGVTR